jgi:hypothetical protein
MPLSIKRQQFQHPFGYETATVNPAVAAEVLEYLFNTTAWKTNPEALRRKVRHWREQLFAKTAPAPAAHASAPAPAAAVESPVEDRVLPAASPEADEAEDWLLKAVELKRQGMGWTKLSVELGRPRATLRRLVEQEFRSRGEAVPLGG